MTAFDISDTLAPNSDQLDAVDLLGGPQVFTISKVSKGNPEQPVQIHLVEFDRPWRPGKSMRRVMVSCWGPDANQYVGRSIKLWCDPKVAFGGQDVGGVRILAMSHIDKPRGIPLLISRGKSATYKVDVLKVEAPKPVLADDAMVDKLIVLYGQKGIAKSEWANLANITVDEARNLWRSLSTKPDASPEAAGDEWAPVTLPGTAK